MQWGKIAIGALTVVIVGLGAVWAIKWFWPTAMDARPKLVEVPPLAPISRSSRIIIPAAITLTALRDAMEQAPRGLSGKAEIPLGPSSAEIAWSAVRGGFGVEGGPNGLKLWTQLRGSLRASAQLGALRAFGLLGLAARSAVPYLERTLAENAVIDLVPLAADARKNIEAANRRIPKDDRRRAGGRHSRRPAPGRHRIRRQDAARDRGGRRNGARRGDRAPRRVTDAFSRR